MSQSRPELPSTAETATVFGQLEVLSGKSRFICSLFDERRYRGIGQFNHD
jgi:hypothetical protein